LFKGHSAGPRFNQGGSGINYLCLPEDPQWKTYLAGSQAISYAGFIAGIEYELLNSGPDHTITTCSQKATTAVIHLYKTQRRVEFATWEVDQQPS